MPELPEVERIRQTLEPHLVGRVIMRARLRRRDICESWVTGKAGPRRARTTAAMLLEGATVKELRRKGKQLAVVARDGRVLCVHLGMSGRLTWRQRLAGAKLHDHAFWEVRPPRGGQGGQVVFRDPRRFGGLWTFDSPAQMEALRWAGLGPDALTLRGTHLAETLEGARRPIKAALLDQRVAAGIGNIYADEALFISRINPGRLARDLARADAAALAVAVRKVLRAAIRAGGSTLRDYRDGNDRPGRHQFRHAVYGRAGRSCTRCGTPLVSGVVAGRTTVWCPRCQAR